MLFGVVASVCIVGEWWWWEEGEGHLVRSEPSGRRVTAHHDTMCDDEWSFGTVFPTFVLDQELTVCSSFKAVMSQTRRIG